MAEPGQFCWPFMACRALLVQRELGKARCTPLSTGKPQCRGAECGTSTVSKQCCKGCEREDGASEPVRAAHGAGIHADSRGRGPQRSLGLSYKQDASVLHQVAREEEHSSHALAGEQTGRALWVPAGAGEVDPLSQSAVITRQGTCPGSPGSFRLLLLPFPHAVWPISF